MRPVLMLRPAVLNHSELWRDDTYRFSSHTCSTHHHTVTTTFFRGKTYDSYYRVKFGKQNNIVVYCDKGMNQMKPKDMISPEPAFFFEFQHHAVIVYYFQNSKQCTRKDVTTAKRAPKPNTTAYPTLSFNNALPPKKLVSLVHTPFTME